MEHNQQVKTRNQNATWFDQVKMGDIVLPNRLVMCALTRIRTDPKTGVPNDLMAEYYSQRASYGFILTECTAISQHGNGFPGCGCIYNDEHVEGWRKVVNAVHQKGGRILMQIWHAGRTAHQSYYGLQPIAPSPIALNQKRKGIPYDVPKEMTLEDIKLVRQQFKQAAINAKKAGFDGVQLHGAHGYLVDQFLRDCTNKRTDQYGGSVENRCRFALEILDDFIEVFGKGRVGIKISPTVRFQDMIDSDPEKLYGYLLTKCEEKGIAFVEIREYEDFKYGGTDGDNLPTGFEQIKDIWACLRKYYSGILIANEKLTKETGLEVIRRGDADLVSFGRLAVANPDLAERFKNNWPLNEPNVKTFYAPGAEGYTDYPFYQSQKL